MNLNVVKKIDEISQNVKEFIIENQYNPILWISLFLGGLIIAMWTFKKLNKEG